MKKLLCLGVLLFFPVVSHAQSQTRGGGSGNPNSASAAAGGSGGAGGSLGGGSTSVSPAIDRHHTADHGVLAFRNPGNFELTEVLPWSQAGNLGAPKPEKDIVEVARESREQAAKETVPARATLIN
jgi:hypothetical protein